MGWKGPFVLVRQNCVSTGLFEPRRWGACTLRLSLRGNDPKQGKQIFNPFTEEGREKKIVVQICNARPGLLSVSKRQRRGIGWYLTMNGVSLKT